MFGHLVHHYTESGLTEQAVDYWRQAGQRAIERSADAEAIANWRRYRCVRRNTDAAPEDYQDPPVCRVRTRRTQFPSIEI